MKTQKLYYLHNMRSAYFPSIGDYIEREREREQERKVDIETKREERPKEREM